MLHNPINRLFRVQPGFTLIELLITIAIIGILSAISIPSYQQYTRKAHYIEIIQAAAPFKLGIEECFQITADLKNCLTGKNGVPENITNGAGLVNKILVGEDSVITITPRKLYGIKPIDNYILTPKIHNDQLLWEIAGGGVTKGYTH